jgi:DNA-binding transcriptional MocR family regulator
MPTWNPQSLPEDLPLYVAIADALARDLEAGRLKPGQRLPTHRSLARRLGVNVMTVTRGYAEAARRGLVEGEVGRGTFVRAQGRPANDFQPLEENGRRLVDFHFNLPAGDPSILDVESTLTQLGREGGATLFHGYSPNGLADHRAAGAEWLARTGALADPERVLITGGAQHGMTLAFSALTSPGDLVLTEELTYPGAKGLASALHLRLQGLPMDAEGLLPDALEGACRRGEAKLLYTMSNVHNPRGVVTTERRRREIVRVARTYGLAIVEDDTYGFLVEQPTAPLQALAPELTYLLTGTSKAMAAGLRVGFLMAPKDDPHAVENLSAYVAAISWMASPLLGELASRWIRGGQADRMVAWKRFEARARRELLRKSLGLEVDCYGGASHVWLPLPEPWRAQEFAAAARGRGVVVTPAETFVVGRSQAPHAVRVCLSTPGSRDEVARGLAILGELYRSQPCVQAAVC